MVYYGVGRLCLVDFGSGFLTFLSWVYLGFCVGWVLYLAILLWWWFSILCACC